MKNLKVDDAGCPSCGSTMIYSPQRQKLYCESCQTTKDIKFVALKEKHPYDQLKLTKQDKDYNAQIVNLSCPNCGASVINNAKGYSDICPYCNSALVANNIVDSVLKPDGIIPFVFSNEEASQKYRQGIKKKWFIPNKFKKAPPTENIKGIYIPCFSYDADTDSTYSGRLATDHTHTDSQGRSHTVTTYKNISGIQKSQQRDILVETSSKINQIQLDEILPYNYSNLVKFNTSFIIGYSVEHFDKSLKDCKIIAENIMNENIKQIILNKYSYDRVVSFNLDTVFTNNMYNYNLIPIYKCDYTYKNKNYTTIMNGQTGMVGGGVPRSPIKITFFVMFILLIIGGIFAIALLS